MTPRQHQRKIALATLKMHAIGVSILGGMSHHEAVAFLRSDGVSDEQIKAKLRDAGHDERSIAIWMRRL